MAKKLVRYLMEGDGSRPLFVEDGGYYILGEEMVGLSVDESARHVPKTVKRMTRAELRERVRSIYKDEKGKYRRDRDNVPMTDQRVELEISAFLERLGLGDLA